MLNAKVAGNDAGLEEQKRRRDLLREREREKIPKADFFYIERR